MKLSFIALVFALVISDSACALDFYGANVNDIDAPSSFMRMGVYGYLPTITEVRNGTYADKAGFKSGDIILEINKKQAKRSSELNSDTADTLNFLTFRGNERIKLSINRLAIETERAARLEAERKAILVRQSAIYEEPQDNNAPAIKFNNATLEKKFGKSTYTPPPYSTPHPTPNQNKYVYSPHVTQSQPIYSAPSFVGSGVIESRIDGDFEGWDGDTIFKLENDQIWQQSSYAYTYHYAYRPKVLIYNSSGTYKLKVDGVGSTINVTRLK